MRLSVVVAEVKRLTMKLLKKEVGLTHIHKAISLLDKKLLAIGEAKALFQTEWDAWETERDDKVANAGHLEKELREDLLELKYAKSSMFNSIMQEACNKFEIAMPTKEDYRHVAEIFGREQEKSLEQPDDGEVTESEESEETDDMDVSEDGSWTTKEEERLETFKKECDIPESVVVSNASGESKKRKTGNDAMWDKLLAESAARQALIDAEEAPLKAAAIACHMKKKAAKRKTNWWFKATISLKNNGKEHMLKKVAYIKGQCNSKDAIRYCIAVAREIECQKFELTLIIGLYRELAVSTIQGYIGGLNVTPIKTVRGDYPRIQRKAVQEAMKNGVPMFEYGNRP